MKWLNKNIYIETILFNTGFWTSACRVMTTLFSHMDYIAVTKPIASGVLWFGKGTIAFVTTVFAAWWLTKIDGVHSILFPSLVVLVLSFSIAQTFAEIYDMGVDTMLLCFCEADGHDEFEMPKCFSSIQDHNGVSVTNGMKDAKANSESRANGGESAVQGPVVGDSSKTTTC